MKPKEHLAYTLDDGRKATVDFEKQGDNIKLTETFEPEAQNPVGVQRDGWQAILDNFKRYAENK